MISELDKRVSEVTGNYAQLMVDIFAELMNLRKSCEKRSDLTPKQQEELMVKTNSLGFLYDFLRYGDEICLDFAKGNKYSKVLEMSLQLGKDISELMDSEGETHFINKAAKDNQ